MRFDVTNNTTSNPNEYIPPALTLPFAPELIQFILDARKSTTYRFGLKYDGIKQSDVVDIQNSETKEIVGKAQILKKQQVTFLDLPLTSDTHESYKDKEHQRRVLSGYYSYVGRPIEDEDVFLIFDFALL